MLCEFIGKENISPITRNSQIKEKDQTDTSDRMEEVMEVIQRKQRENDGEAVQQGRSSSKQEDQEQNNPNTQLSTSKTGTRPKESDTMWRNTLSSKRMLDFDTINLDDSIFEDDPDSEIENENENQTQIKPEKRNLHNGQPTSSLDREIQIHHNR